MTFRNLVQIKVVFCVLDAAAADASHKVGAKFTRLRRFALQLSVKQTGFRLVLTVKVFRLMREETVCKTACAVWVAVFILPVLKY